MITYPVISFQTDIDDKSMGVDVLTQVLDRGQFRFYVKFGNGQEDIYVHDAIHNSWFSEHNEDCEQACFKAVKDDLVTLEYYPVFKKYLVHRKNINGEPVNIWVFESQREKDVIIYTVYFKGDYQFDLKKHRGAWHGESVKKGKAVVDPHLVKEIGKLIDNSIYDTDLWRSHAHFIR
ncbi:hypothetical protein [Terrimonas pollutisoli]|uniref:hypothetical protein n=1 Tax=Terrimonas pollutisoli TaxID=3034147 RepID=UPI0023EAE0B6|nr:hypothetical protein [Terrimonas sp. H1YJ31]